MGDMPEKIWVYEGAYDNHTWIEHEDGYTEKGGGTEYTRSDLTTELADALEGVIAVSDRKTAEYDKAKAALKKVGR